MAVLLLIVLYDFDENTLLSFNGLYWVLYTAALARLEFLAIKHKEVRAAVGRVASVPGFGMGVEAQTPSYIWWALPPANTKAGAVHGVPGSPWL